MQAPDGKMRMTDVADTFNWIVKRTNDKNR